ncbi:MAG: YlbF family regulator [Sporomusaceae bacterium]|jgi:cell fate (sporulation/competence/biofilm development) regulator YlbF (YheA/YmcA/DUF963 family)|nr:YlbF family regulator [Sporomusaceae bacterium]
MLEKEIKKQAKRLSRLLVDSEEFQNLVKAQQAVHKDQDAYQIMMDYQKLGMEANNNRMMGIAMSQKEMQALSAQEAKVQANTLLKHWDKSQTVFNKMMEEVLQVIREELSAKPPAREQKTGPTNSERVDIFSQTH